MGDPNTALAGVALLVLDVAADLTRYCCFHKQESKEDEDEDVPVPGEAATPIRPVDLPGLLSSSY